MRGTIITLMMIAAFRANAFVVRPQAFAPWRHRVVLHASEESAGQQRGSNTTISVGADRPARSEQRQASAIGRVQEWAIENALRSFANSDAVRRKHAAHVEGDTAVHLMQGTPFARATDAQKLRLVDSPAGGAVAALMELERKRLGDWKLSKIVEARERPGVCVV